MLFNLKCVSIFCAAFVWNVSHSKKNRARYQECVLVFLQSTRTQWRCLGPQYGTCFVSPFWRLGVGGTSYISRTFMDSCCHGRPKTLEGPGQAWNTAGGHFWGRTRKLQIIFGEILLLVESLSLPAPYFRLLQVMSSVLLVGWCPKAASRLARPLARPCL